MTMSNIDIEKFIIKARELIGGDRRNPLERGARKRPKIDFLNAISELIASLLDGLFSVSEQVHLLNTIDKKFAISNTTYFKFLNETLNEEYERFKKNRLFAQNAHKIKDAMGLYPSSPKIQFSAVFGACDSVSFEDFEFFMQTYYSKNADSFFAPHKVRMLDTKTRNLVFDGEAYRYVDVVEPAEKISDVVGLLKNKEPRGDKSEERRAKSESAGKKGEGKAVVAASGSLADGEAVVDKKRLAKERAAGVSSGNTLKNFTVYETVEQRDVLRDAEGDFRINLVDGASLGEHRDIFKIIENRDEFPKEILNSKFLFADYCSSSLKFKEQYVFLRDADLIQFADPETYGLVEGLLFVCGTEYTDLKKGYLCYRYFKGSIYFIERLSFPGGNPTLSRELDNWANKNLAAEFNEFGEAYLDGKSCPQLPMSITKVNANGNSHHDRT